MKIIIFKDINNIYYMSVESIINFIDNKNYITNNEISFSNYFKGDYNDYLKYDKNLINIFKKNYENNCLFTTERSIIIEDDKNYRILVYYNVENEELFWTIKIL
jgi:hypothetical protein